MPELVLELGTEEMPAGAIADALEQLRNEVARGLGDARLEPACVATCGTPRRLVVRASGLAERQPDRALEVRGPALSVAYDAAGKPTGAAQGFARKQGVPVESLGSVQTPQGAYVVAQVTDAGRTAIDVIGPILESAIRALFFPKMMRWGDATDGRMRFVRPVRWIVALLDEEVVPLEVAGVRSGRLSRGHRFLSPASFEIDSAASYADRVRAACVMLDPEERRTRIRAEGDRLAAELNGTVPWDDTLLDENVWLVEWPTALRGAFDPVFLELPRPVLVTAMKKHQRFFPVQDGDGRLLPAFVSIRSGGDEGLDLVREGNERVLTARFSDARHFFEQDRKTSLADLVSKLDRLVFQEKLGTISDKRARLERLAAALAHVLPDADVDAAAAVRAAHLCKADLVSRMVIELPALQGVIGREYALAADEDPRVATAIMEHYLPKSSGGDLPASPLGRLLAVADRIDTLTGYVGIGILPSGSSDPYGLRRAAQGVVQLLADQESYPALDVLITAAADGYAAVNGLEFPIPTLLTALQELFDQRIAAALQDQGVRYDLIDSALPGGPVHRGVVHAVMARGLALQALHDDPAFVVTVQAGARVANILRSVPNIPMLHATDSTLPGILALYESLARAINAGLFVHESEHALYNAGVGLIPDAARAVAARSFEALYRALDRLREPVNNFFDDVMVMADDEGVRRNRLVLLQLIDALYKSLAEMNKVVIA